MLSEASGEGFDDGIEPFGGHGSHVEHAANGLAAAADRSFAFHGAAVPIEGSQTDEGRDLLTVELADLGNIGHDGRGGDVAQTRYGLDEPDFVLPVVVRFKQGLDELIDSADFGFESVDHGLNAFPGGLDLRDVPAIGLLSADVDELPPTGDKLLDFDLFFGSF